MSQDGWEITVPGPVAFLEIGGESSVKKIRVMALRRTIEAVFNQDAWFVGVGPTQLARTIAKVYPHRKNDMDKIIRELKKHDDVKRKKDRGMKLYSLIGLAYGLELFSLWLKSLGMPQIAVLYLPLSMAFLIFFLANIFSLDQTERRDHIQKFIRRANYPDRSIRHEALSHLEDIAAHLRSWITSPFSILKWNERKELQREINLIRDVFLIMVRHRDQNTRNYAFHILGIPSIK